MAPDTAAEKAPPGSRRTGSVQSSGSVRGKLGSLRSGRRSIIGMQVTSTILRMIEIDKSVSPPRVVNFSSIDPLMENITEAADQIRGLMHEKGITARVVNTLVCDKGVEHRLIALPVLGRGEMQGMVRREVKKVVPEAKPSDITFDFWRDKNVKKSTRKSDVLIGVVPRESPEKIIALMEAVELETQVISTVPLALIAAMKLMVGQVEDKVVSMIHLERHRSHLVIANRGNWVFSREFPTVLAKEEPEEPEDLKLDARRKFASARYMVDQDRLLTEVNRSFLYFKQRFRGEGVSLSILSGEAVNLDKISVEFTKNLGIAAEIFSPVSGLQYQDLGERAGKLERIFPSLSLPLGAAMQSVREARLNFVPASYISRRKNRLRKVLMTAVSVALLTVITAGYVMLRGSSNEAERLYKRKVRENMVTQLNKNLERISLVTNERSLAEARKKFLGKFTGQKGPEQQLLVALSGLVPDDVVLYRVWLDKSNGNHAEIVGKVEGRADSNPDAAFNKFYQGLQNSGLFSGMEEAQTEITRDKSGVAQLSFQVDCLLSE